MQQVVRALLQAASQLEASNAHDAERRFMAAARRIWGDSTIDQLTFSVRVEAIKDDVLAALSYKPANHSRRATGSILRWAPPDKHFNLILNPRLFDKDDDVVEKIMIHEAVHIGYSRHDANFEQLVKEHGGALTENDALGLGFQVQIKEGARFKMLKRFDDQFEAVAWMRQQHRENPGRYRVVY